MARKRRCRYSGIGGQAVLEGIMMKNGDDYAVAVRKPDGGIEVKKDRYPGICHGKKVKSIPFVRGIFNFIDSLILGNRALNYSASFYEEEETKAQEEAPKRTEKKKVQSKEASERKEKALTTFVTILAIVLALGIFVVLPYYIASLLRGFIRNASLMAIVEGLIRILIFILYIWLISAMKDIRRLYCYHGAEHKCINCIERGRTLTVENVMRSSRLHKRCGTSFIFFVFFVSIILFFFIRVENPLARVLIRILLMPVIAGISYEIIRLAGRSDNFFVRILSAPGMLIQRMTTKEPDAEMVQVAIAAVEAVFDWKAYLRENFGYEAEEETEQNSDVEEIYEEL